MYMNCAETLTFKSEEDCAAVITSNENDLVSTLHSDPMMVFSSQIYRLDRKERVR